MGLCWAEQEGGGAAKFIANSNIGRLAGVLALQVGKRPTEILGLSESPIEDLLLDVAILEKVLPKETKSLTEEIMEKRRRWAYRYFG